MQVWEDELITKPLDLHMNEDIFTWYLKDHILETKQTPAHVNYPPKKLVTEDKIEPLGFQKVGFKNGQLGITRLNCLIMRFEMKKCQSQHVLLHPEG
jgi:hypothetical protein